MLYKEKNYTIELPYLFNQYIREYDISKANISILAEKGAITKKIYDQLYNSDRMFRQIYIGKMIKFNDQIQEVLNEGIIEYKQKFFEINRINDNDIVSIKNDAVPVQKSSTLSVEVIFNYDTIILTISSGVNTIPN